MNFFIRAIPGLREHLQHQRDQARLLNMPDYLLEDIGLTREQVSRNSFGRWLRD